MLIKKIFLASSAELKDDRNQFEILMCRKNKEWVKRDVFLELVMWEDFLDAVSRTRLQDEYNQAIRDCDIFVTLFCAKVGKYTEEEFETAFKQFKATNKPFIFTYFKKTQLSTDAANRKDLLSLLAFQEKLDALGHFQTEYKNTEELLLHFTQQLEKLADSGFVEFKRDQDVPTASAGIAYQATNTGSGAIAQGGGNAVAEGAVYVAGQNSGNINTGTQITGNVSGRGIPIGTGAQSSVTQGISPRDLEPLFAQLLAAVAKEVPPERRADVVQRVAELKSEVARDKQADDCKIARILEGLVDMVPAAVASIVGTFATPLLGGIAGPLTKSLLNRLKLD